MNLQRFLLLAIAFHVSTALADEPLPYDRLSRDNIVLKASIGESGKRLNEQTLRTTYGTYQKNVSSYKEVLIEAPLFTAGPARSRLEAFAIYKNHNTKQIKIEPEEVTEAGPSKFCFILSAESQRERWMYAENGRVSQHGWKILGWFVRAIVDNRIVGIAASSLQYEAMAAAPNPQAAMEKTAR